MTNLCLFKSKYFGTIFHTRISRRGGAKKGKTIATNFAFVWWTLVPVFLLQLSFCLSFLRDYWKNIKSSCHLSELFDRVGFGFCHINRSFCAVSVSDYGYFFFYSYLFLMFARWKELKRDGGFWNAHESSF